MKYIGIHKLAATQGQVKSKKIYDIIDEMTDILIKNEDTSKHLADYYFTNLDYMFRIRGFISGRLQVFAEDEFDFNNEEVNRKLDMQIEGFVNNFNLQIK